MANPKAPSTAPAAKDQGSRLTQLLVVFTAAIFLSAALLFAVQPMFTKLVLPYLGGAPAVWSVAMVFFQATLLAGYAYAHLLTRYAPGRRSVFIHLGLMALACFWLPLSIATSWGRPPQVGEAFWLLGLFAVSIGPPFFALAANAPLLQAWFARTDHPSANDPYFLYAASNVGSFLALLSYPILIEPFIPLSTQTLLWAGGFVVLIVLIAGCGYLLWQSPEREAAAARPAAPSARAVEAAPPTWTDVAHWVFLAAVPSGLLVAVTAHISTDVAAVPLLWVVPLALYLLTFVIVFARQPIIPHWFVVEIQPVFVLALVAVLVYEPFRNIVYLMGVHIAVFFVLTLMCHGELAQRRPPARYLTSFYMWMSFGGMIGGISAGLAAPYLFNWIAEYPILIMLAVLCRPGLVWPKTTGQYLLVFGSIVLAVLGLVVFRMMEDSNLLTLTAYHWTLGGLLILTVLFWRNPVPFAAIIGAVLLAQHMVVEGNTTLTVRSFFGVMKVNDTSSGFRTLSHGTTLHGGQRIRDRKGNPVTGRPEPTMYYYDGSAIAQGIDAARAVKGGPINWAVIGLGTGSLICRSQPGETVHYYEIDAAMVRIARDPILNRNGKPENAFTFLRDCAPDAPIIMGDARLTLADAKDGSYDIIVVDAFTSDAIPIHLLTREAMAIYQRKLSPNGMVLIHISNRHLELASVVTGIAAANGMVTRVSESGDVVESDDDYKFLGTVTVSARKDEDFGPIAKSQYWELQKPNPRQRVWTDDYSNIVGSLIRQWRGE